MNVTSQKYAQALYDLVQDKEDKNAVKSILHRFVVVLNNNHVLSKIDNIIKHFLTIYNKKTGILDVKIVSRFKLNDDVINELKRYISRKTGYQNVNIVNIIDDSILGGVVIKYNDHVLDVSLNNVLQQLRSKMIK